MYRETAKSKRLRIMREAKELKRLSFVGPPEPQRELPKLRKTIIVIDRDFGREIHRFDLYRTGRIDQYRVTVDGKEWKKRIGLSGILAGIRKSMPPIKSLH